MIVLPALGAREHVTSSAEADDRTRASGPASDREIVGGLFVGYERPHSATFGTVDECVTVRVELQDIVETTFAEDVFTCQHLRVA